MSKWEQKKLSEVCQINPRLPRDSNLSDDLDVSFLPMVGIDEKDAKIRDLSVRRLGDVRKGFTCFENNDILFAKITPCMENGKAAISRKLINGIGFGSTEFHVLRPCREVLPEWVLFFIRQPSFREQAAKNFTGSAGQKRVPTEFMARTKIPVPSLFEQERIIKLLDEADELRKLRNQSDKRSAELIPALFNEMFGDTETNPKGFPVRQLCSICKVVGGGTPSKKRPDYWQGDIPWVSPKDMYDAVVKDSEDHISEAAIKESATNLIPKGSILIVTRSGVLKHTLPVAITAVPVTINQDIKAFIPQGDCIPSFLTEQIRGLAPKILGMVRVGATVQNLETEALKNMAVLFPPTVLQKEFSSRVSEIRAMESEQSSSRQSLDALFQSMLHRAFQGEL